MSSTPTRRDEILQALATQLQDHPGARITTAGLARAVGVSEAALYRHFPSKARMFEALIGFAEEAVFGRFNEVLSDTEDTVERVRQLVWVVLAFSERNAGITRLLLGSVLVGEADRLLARVQQFFERVETQLRQVLRENRLRSESDLRLGAEAGAALLLAYTEGTMQRFVRSRFERRPLAYWETDWAFFETGLFGLNRP